MTEVNKSSKTRKMKGKESSVGVVDESERKNREMKGK